MNIKEVLRLFLCFFMAISISACSDDEAQYQTETILEYSIQSDSPNPFILPSDGGKFEIPFTCRRVKKVDGNLTEDSYYSLDGLRYSIYSNFGGKVKLLKNGEKTGFYKLEVEGIPPYNMSSTPVWYFAIYPKDANLVTGPEPESLFKQFFEQPQTPGEDYSISSIQYWETGTLRL